MKPRRGGSKEGPRVAVLVTDPLRPGDSGEKGEAKGRDRAAATGAGPGRILLATADPREVRTLRSILSAEAWEIGSACGGEEALREITRGREPDPPAPGLVVMGLPLSGPYGRLILEAVGERGSCDRWPVLALTREGSAAERRQALESGADMAVERPVDAEDLLSRARLLVELHRARLEAAMARAAHHSAEEELAAVRSSTTGFAQRLAHDLKNPLTGIMGTAQLLQMKYGVSQPQVDTYALRILASAHQVQQTLADLRDLELLREGRFRMNLEAVDLQSSLNVVLEDHRGEAEANGVELELVPSKADGRRHALMVRADAELLLRLLSSLVADALRHAPPEGRVRVLVGSPSDRRVEIHISTLADEVHDDDAGLHRGTEGIRGRGSARPRLERGLRASFCRAVVSALDGRIWVKPNAAGGSTVGLLLPAEGGRAA